ncbi:MAG: hypothetical protein NUV51_02395 [Sulfuricaulis sp.]|nr:hypothetical protein [Sulfuricaulis sp.]
MTKREQYRLSRRNRYSRRKLLASIARAILPALLAMCAPWTSFAWTTADIRVSTPENWVVQNIASIPNADGTVTIHYRVTEPAYVNLRVHGTRAPFPLLRQLLTREFRLPGNYEEAWDARDDSGQPLPYLQWQLVLRAEPVNFSQQASHPVLAIAED